MGRTVRGNGGTVTYTSLWKGDRKESTMIVHCGSQEMRRWKQERWNQGCLRRGTWVWRIGVGSPSSAGRGEVPEKPWELRYQWGRNDPSLGALEATPSLLWQMSLSYSTFPVPKVDQVLMQKTHCLKVVHVQSHQQSLSSSHLLWPAVSKPLLCSVLGRIKSHYWLLPQEQTDMRTCLKGAAWTSLDDIINLLTFPLVERITLSNVVQSFSCSACFN